MTNVRQCLMLCILLLTGSGTAFSVNYPKAFGDDWTSAAQFVHEHHAAWKPLFEEFGVDARLAEAIVFPELIRYSRWQDEIETAAVNGLYVLQGTSGANFSIGRFQMKPSFAEEVEAAWNQSALAKEYGFVFNLQDVAPASDDLVRWRGNAVTWPFSYACNSCAIHSFSHCPRKNRWHFWPPSTTALFQQLGSKPVSCAVRSISILI